MNQEMCTGMYIQCFHLEVNFDLTEVNCEMKLHPVMHEVSNALQGKCENVNQRKL